MSKKHTKKLPKPDIQGKVNIQTPSESKGEFSVRFKLAILLGVISLIVYANTLRNGFVLDDITVITQNSIVSKGVSAIPEIFCTPYRRGYHISPNDLYRPLSLSMFAIERQFFGINPIAYHFTNIILFAGCVILLFLFLDQLFYRKKMAVAFIASLLFAIHPIHTEVVANVKSSDELLCFFFAFLSLNVFIKYLQTGKKTHLIIGSLFFFISLLSKETVITFLAIIPLIFFFYRDENKKRSAYITVGIVFAAIIFLIIRFSVLNFYHANEITNISFIDNSLAKLGLPFESRIATAVLILGYYIKLLFVPYPLICDYSYNSISFVSFKNIDALFSLAIYSLLIVFGIRRFLKNKKDAIAFSVLFFLITISLFSNIPFLIGTTMGERLMFFPSIGFCLFVPLALEKWVARSELTYPSFVKNTFILVTLIPVCLIFMGLTIVRNNDWKDDYTIFTTDIKKQPNSTRININCGREIVTNAFVTEKDTAKQKKIILQGISYLKNTTTIYPNYNDAYTIIGLAYLTIFDYDSAERYFVKAFQIHDTSSVEINNLANVYFQEKKYAQAIEVYKKAIKTNLNDTIAYERIAISYFGSSQYDSSEVYCIKALNLNPENMPAIDHLAGIYYMKNNYVKAISFFKKTIKLEPDSLNPYTNISVCYLNLGKNDSAIYYLNKAISIAPNNKQSYEMLSVAYKTMGNLELSQKYETIAQQK